MSKIQREAIDAAVDWWAANWQKAGSKAAFRAALHELVTAYAAEEDGRILLECDYDPQGLLLQAVQTVEPNCRGFMFSAEGLLPMKTHTWIRPHEVTLKHGYGAPDQVLWRSLDQEPKP